MKEKISISAEFFPPKTEEGARQILRAANAMKNFKLDFVSITYGAGGSSRERTLEYGELLRDIFEFDVMPHLTCVGHSVAEIREILKGFTEKKFTKVMALRGDPPKNVENFVQHPDGLKHASELIKLIKDEFPALEIACAGYPEKHPEADSFASDIAHLKEKTSLGASTILTQLFFDNSSFYNFVKECKASGINASIHAGIMPALSLKQVTNFCAMCGAKLPQKLKEQLSSTSDDAEQRKIGLDWAKAQISDLLQNDVDGIHFYILNREESALELLNFAESKMKK